MKFICENNELLTGIQRLAPEISLSLEDDGFTVTVQKDEDITLSISENGATIGYSTKPGFYRALSLLVQYKGQAGFTLKQSPMFDTNGLMLDCSRNAVSSVESVKELIRRMALMGHNLLMLYTEDTYEIPEQPFFGYLRGRFSHDELREMDDYAYGFGIEMIPCIQTLGHLERVLHWFEMRKYRDTDDVLNVMADETYELIEQMLVNATKPFRSNRIHIGMDEAYTLGLGRVLRAHGYLSQPELMKNHLAKIRGLLEKHNLHAMMWSDMHFSHVRAKGYYDAPDEECIAGAPEEIDLVYWDYYREQQDKYDTALRLHKYFTAKTWFAGGIWMWNGFAPDYRKTLAATLPALQACKESGIKHIFATAWGDDGAETPMQCLYYGLQLYAEYCWTGEYNEQACMDRFAVCAGANGKAFLDMTLFNQLPGIEPLDGDVCIPGRMLLYEDPLMPLFEKDLEGVAKPEYYEELKACFERHRNANPRYEQLMELYVQFANTLALKCRWRNAAAPAVRANDRQAAKALVPLAAEVAVAYTALRDAWRTLWLSSNKPNGFEVIDIRVGGCIARMQSAAARMADYAEGRIEDIPELREEKLQYYRNDDGRLRCFNLYNAHASVCRIANYY